MCSCVSQQSEVMFCTLCYASVIKKLFFFCTNGLFSFVILFWVCTCASFSLNRFHVFFWNSLVMNYFFYLFSLCFHFLLPYRVCILLVVICLSTIWMSLNQMLAMAAVIFFFFNQDFKESKCLLLSVSVAQIWHSLWLCKVYCTKESLSC